MGYTIVLNVQGGKQANMSFQEMKRNILGLDDAVSHLGNKLQVAGGKMDFLRQRAFGLKRDVSAIRNDILLFVFSVGGVIGTLTKAITAATKFQVALAGVTSIALATGNSIADVRDAAISLTQDGLLTITSASEGLKNLLATGLGLKESVKIMNVFKDAASFNRQGILAFEEAIVRATAGVKMQNAKLIDDVGIRTRVGQLLERQGYQLEDLTNEVTRAAALQALYNGLLKEGRYFAGDAAKLTATYAGVHAQLEAQIQRTTASLGKLFIGAEGIGGIFKTGEKEITKFLEKIRLFIEANKSLIAVKIDQYFEEIIDLGKKLLGIFELIAKPLLFIFDILVSTGIIKWTIFGMVLLKIFNRVKDIQYGIYQFFGGGLSAPSLKGSFTLFKLGENIDNVSKRLTLLRTAGINTFADINKHIKETSVGFVNAQNAMLKEALRMRGGWTTGKRPLKSELKLVGRMEDIVYLENRFQNIQKITDNLSLGNIAKAQNELLKLRKGIEAVASTEVGKKFAASFRPVITNLETYSDQLNRFKADMKIIEGQAGTGIGYWFKKIKVDLGIGQVSKDFKGLRELSKNVSASIIGDLDKQKTSFINSYSNLRNVSKNIWATTKGQQLLFTSELKAISELLSKEDFAKGFKNIGLARKRLDALLLNPNFAPFKKQLEEFSEKMNSFDNTLIKSGRGVSAFGNAFAIMGNKISAAAKSIATSLKLMWSSFWPMLVLQGIIWGIMELINHFKSAKEKVKELRQEEIARNQALIELNKEISDSRLAELNKLKELTEEYNNLDYAIIKSFSDYDRLNKLYKDIIAISQKYNIELIKNTQGNIDYAKSVDLVSKSIEKINIDRLKKNIIDAELEIKQINKQNIEIFTTDWEEGFENLEKIIDAARSKKLFEEIVTPLTLVKERMESSLEVAKKLVEAGHWSYQEGLKWYEEKTKDMGFEIGSIMMKISEKIKAAQEKLYKAPKEQQGKIFDYIENLKRIKSLMESFNFIDISPFINKLKDLDNQLESFGKIEESLIPISKKFELFVSKLNTEALKAQGFGRISDKINAGITKVKELFKDWESVRKSVTSEQMKTMSESQIVSRIIDIGLTSIKGHLKEITEQYKSQNREIDLEIQKLGKSSLQTKLLEIEAKKVNDVLKARLEIISNEGEIAEIKSQIELRKKEQAIYSFNLYTLSSEQRQRYKENIEATDIMEKALKLYEEMNPRLKEYIDNVERLQIKLKEWAIIEDKLEKIRKELDFSLEVERYNKDLSKTLILLNTYKDRQDIVSNQLEYQSKLLEIQHKIRIKENEIQENLIRNEGDKSYILEKELKFLEKQLENEEVVYKIKEKQLEIEYKLIKAQKESERQTRKKYGITSFTGSLIDIATGGEQLGIRENIENIHSIVSETENKINANLQKMQELKDRRDELFKVRREGMDIEKVSKEANEISNILENLAKDNLDIQERSNAEIFKSFVDMFSKLAHLAESTFDIFGLKSFEAMEQIKANVMVENALLEDQFKNREITVEEYEIRRAAVAKKASLERIRAEKLAAAEQKLAIGNLLKAMAIEFAVKSIAALAEAIFLGQPQMYEASALFAAAAGLAYAGSIPLIKAGMQAKIQAEAEYQREVGLLEASVNRRLNKSAGAEATSVGQSISGTITAQELKIIIAPSITITGENIMIGNIGVEEVGKILGDMSVNRIQEAIENRELQFKN